MSELMRPKFRSLHEAKAQTSARALMGQRVLRQDGSIFIPLPPELWEPIEGGCRCVYCSNDRTLANPSACWDTLAIGCTEGDYAQVVHMPEAHGAPFLRAMS